MSGIFAVVAAGTADAEGAQQSGLYNFFANPSATVTLTSDYVFRGISQTDAHPAFQGALSFGQTAGLYLGLSGSNVDFNDGDEASVEIDLSGGYKWDWGPVSLDGGVIYYAYPGASGRLDYDYWEGKLAAAVPAGPVTFTGAVFLSPDYFAGSGTGVYLNGAARVPVFDTGITANAAIGHQYISHEAAFGAPDYTDWTAGLAYTWEKFTIAVAYDDTTIVLPQCLRQPHYRLHHEGFSLTRNFDWLLLFSISPDGITKDHREAIIWGLIDTDQDGIGLRDVN